MALLSEQLQNERATISRAVAQNLALKEQLKELQDKIILVTNESAAKEVQLQALMDRQQSSQSSAILETPPSTSSSPVIDEETLHRIEQRLEIVLKENDQFRVSNERLQYWLTALETENESIGEYVALYRYQRQNVQKKIAERDEQNAKLEAECSVLRVRA